MKPYRPTRKEEDRWYFVAVNNLLSPAVVFENRLCGGASLQVALRLPGSGNRYALGARVSLVTSAGTYVRQMRSTAGYLSGEPPRLHFGLPAGPASTRCPSSGPTDSPRASAPTSGSNPAAL
ncbi:MAG: ASPIC/UnbV domain-containing protein [Spirochaetaceae bacterium]|nr:ASPIC/UnbV domain-containing protein [Spirochaetaceae bacterium]